MFRWDDFLFEDLLYDVIFIDSYEADESIYQKLTKCSRFTIAIDDYKRINYPTKIIINFAVEAEKIFFNKKEKEKKYLLGLDYIPIRDIFFTQKEKKKKKIFIMLGGSDTNNLSATMIDCLRDINIKKVVVINNKNAKKLMTFKDIEILFKPTQKELISQMVTSSYAITTASMSIYELSFLQIPTIIISVSKNQAIGAPQIIQNNLAEFYIDISKNNWQQSLEEKMKILISRKDKKETIIDGLGAKRIYEKINKWINK